MEIATNWSKERFSTKSTNTFTTGAFTVNTKSIGEVCSLFLESPPLISLVDLLSGIILALVFIICMGAIVVSAISGFKWHQERERLRFSNVEIPDFTEGRPKVTLAQILADPDIPHILFCELTLIKRLGAGASGVVSHARWDRTDLEPRDVAIKEVTIVGELDEYNLQEFLVEIKLMRSGIPFLRFCLFYSPFTMQRPQKRICCGVSGHFSRSQ